MGSEMINIQSVYRFLGVFLGIYLGLFSFVEAAFLNVQDATAGSSVEIRMSNLLSDEVVGFNLSKPDGKVVRFEGVADDLGVLNTEVFGLHLRKAGDYRLEAVRQYQLEQPIYTSFTISPGPVSAYRTKVESAVSSLPANGETESPFKVFVEDAYGNPIPDQKVQVLSSRNDDIVISHGLSDRDGIVRGKVVSKTPGVTILSALVGDTVIFDKSEIIFHLPQNDLGNVGSSGNLGRFLKAQLFEEGFEEVAYFAIEELPAEVITERNYTFKVVAKDQNGSVVKNYTGTVRFSSSDNEAQLPADYEFTEEDQGEHTFALAVTFGSPGQHELVVNDKNNFNIKGQQVVQVYDEDRTGENPDDQALTIITPLEGTYSASRMTITGKGPAGANIKLLDGPTTLIEDLVIDSNADFVYQTPNLADGRHKFIAAFMDDSVVSNEVSILIDQTPPRVLAVEVDPPDGVDPSSVFQVRVSSNEPLASATCVFNEISQSLKQAGTAFSGNYQAPNACGEYPISCTVADLMGNELQEPNATTVKVCGGGGGGDGKDTDGDQIPDSVEGYELDDDGDCVLNWLESKTADSDGDGINDQEDADNDSDGGGIDNTQECKTDETDPLNPEDDKTGDGNNNSNIHPTAVLNLSASPGDKRVTLYWSPAKDDQEVSKYKVLFSTDPNNLTQQNITPDPRTQWYVDGLEEGTKYFFKVLAIDVNGNEGVPSNMVEATTNGDVYHSAAVPRSGAEQWLPFILAFIGGFLFLLLSRAKRS